MSKNLKHGDELLRQISVELQKHTFKKVGELEVVFSDKLKSNCFVFTLQFALTAIAQDLYWDETGDWSECDTVEVRSY